MMLGEGSSARTSGGKAVSCAAIIRRSRASYGASSMTDAEAWRGNNPTGAPDAASWAMDDAVRGYAARITLLDDDWDQMADALCFHVAQGFPGVEALAPADRLKLLLGSAERYSRIGMENPARLAKEAAEQLAWLGSDEGEAD